jgi:hypothetical protein
MGSAWRCRENGGVKGSRKKGGREPAERRKQRGGSREEEAERRKQRGGSREEAERRKQRGGDD